MEGIGLLFDVLSLARPGALGDGFAEEGHEFADGSTGESRVGGEIALCAELDGGFVLILEDLCGSVRYGGRFEDGAVERTPM